MPSIQSGTAFFRLAANSAYCRHLNRVETPYPGDQGSAGGVQVRFGLLLRMLESPI